MKSFETGIGQGPHPEHWITLTAAQRDAIRAEFDGLPVAIVTALTHAGFWTKEEVAKTSDVELLQVRNLGLIRLVALRSWLRQPVAQSQEARVCDTFTDDQVHEVPASPAVVLEAQARSDSLDFKSKVWTSQVTLHFTRPVTQEEAHESMLELQLEHETIGRPTMAVINHTQPEMERGKPLPAQVKVQPPAPEVKRSFRFDYQYLPNLFSVPATVGDPALTVFFGDAGTVDDPVIHHKVDDSFRHGRIMVLTLQSGRVLVERFGGIGVQAALFENAAYWKVWRNADVVGDARWEPIPVPANRFVVVIRGETAAAFGSAVEASDFMSAHLCQRCRSLTKRDHSCCDWRSIGWW